MKQKNILNADDEKLVLELLVSAIEAEGHRCYTASNGAEAVEIAKNNPIDLALLDKVMPIELVYEIYEAQDNGERKLVVKGKYERA